MAILKKTPSLLQNQPFPYHTLRPLTMYIQLFRNIHRYPINGSIRTVFYSPKADLPVTSSGYRELNLL